MATKKFVRAQALSTAVIAIDLRFFKCHLKLHMTHSLLPYLNYITILRGRCHEEQNDNPAAILMEHIGIQSHIKILKTRKEDLQIQAFGGCAVGYEV